MLLTDSVTFPRFFGEMISIYLPDKNHISLQFVIILSFLKWNHLLEENPLGFQKTANMGLFT